MEKKKILSEIKLNQLSKAALDERQMNALKGGTQCVCIGCVCMGGIAAMDKADGTTSEEVTNEMFFG